ncbi:MAG: sigma-70 family RNA polymerase sigma factor [Lachnospiraceae bacterium]
MEKEHQIVQEVYAAKQDNEKADAFIGKYLPFICAEVSRCMGRPCTKHEDEYSIALMAFHEAILGYEEKRGAFFSYASLTIRSRIMDFQRKENRHRGQVSLYDGAEEEDRMLMEMIPDEKDEFTERDNLEATKQEIEELSEVMKTFGVGFADVADHSPRQERTREACMAAVQFAIRHKELLEELLRTHRLPMKELAEGAGVERKTLERHRKYLLAMLLIQTNGYEIIRGHLKRVINRKEGASE